MPKFRITHSIETTITHEVDAADAKEANGIAVGLTFERARQVHDANPDVDFGPVDDRWGKPVRLPVGGAGEAGPTGEVAAPGSTASSAR